VEAEETALACRTFGVDAATFKADIADPAGIAPMVDAVVERFGRLDALVNNAGMTGRASVLSEADDRSIIDTINLNVTGLILCTKAAVRHMSISRGGAGGAIVNISSGAATLGSPGEFTWYAASKGAVDSFTLGISKEVVADGIRVNAVSLGLFDTDLHESTGVPDRVERLVPTIPIQRPGTLEEIARPILFLLSDDASYIAGAIIRVAGGR
jgi:NAD(P)-dependent dehydrogenase (short-subunit alcohol dehydrogenase family)